MRMSVKQLMEWEFYVGTEKFVVGVLMQRSRGGEYLFSVRLPGYADADGEVTGSDINQLRKDVEARIHASYVKKWKRYIYVQFQSGREIRPIPDNADEIRQLLTMGDHSLRLHVGIVEMGTSASGSPVFRYPEGSWYDTCIKSGKPDIAKFEIDRTAGQESWETGALLPYTLTMARAVTELCAQWWALDQRLLDFSRHKLKEKLLKMHLEGVDVLRG